MKQLVYCVIFLAIFGINLASPNQSLDFLSAKSDSVLTYFDRAVADAYLSGYEMYSMIDRLEAWQNYIGNQVNVLERDAKMSSDPTIWENYLKVKKLLPFKLYSQPYWMHSDTDQKAILQAIKEVSGTSIMIIETTITPGLACSLLCIGFFAVSIVASLKWVGLKKTSHLTLICGIITACIVAYGLYLSDYILWW